jgi:tetratricopeptide (TPR) repeat protein
VKFSRANMVAAASVVVALASLSLTAFVLLQRGGGLGTASAPAAASAAISATAKAQVAAAYAKLDIPARAVELVSEKAARLRAAIKREDFAAASDIAAAVQAQSQVQGWDYQPFHELTENYLDVLDPAFGSHLDNWVAARPGQALPLLLRAQYHYRHGWQIRGSDYANKVPAADMRGFANEMQLSLEDAEAAIKLDGGDPFAHLMRLRVLHGGGPSQRLFDAFTQATARYPDYYQLYIITLDALQPKWGGTTAQMQQFVDHYAGPAPANSPLKLLYLELYGAYVGVAADGCWQHDKPQDCMAASLPYLVTPALQAHLRDALQLYDQADGSPAGHYRFGLEIEPIFTRMLSNWTADFYSGATLQLAATAMHSDTQLKQEHPGGNDYMIDKLLARSWFRKGYYDNAVTKAQDALKDIAATTFPGEAEKDQAMAGVYMVLSDAYASLAQYPAAIAAAQAGRDLGDRKEKDHLACYAYDMLQAYDAALEACNATIARDPDNMTVYFWRARAYDELGRKDEALKDYALVAGSHHGFRSDAAIDMSMIYFGRKDNQGALDLLNGYSYLFDPALSSENTVAIAYNNRCYALMEMGELQQALADCRQSLKHGSIPEAFRKEQELLKRLGDKSDGDKNGGNTGEGAPKTNL